MPNLVGLNLSEAQASLTSTGVYKSYPVYQFLSPPQINVLFQKNPALPGTVIAQSPVATTGITPGASVYLVLSPFPVGVALDAGVVVVSEMNFHFLLENGAGVLRLESCGDYLLESIY